MVCRMIPATAPALTWPSPPGHNSLSFTIKGILHLAWMCFETSRCVELQEKRDRQTWKHARHTCIAKWRHQIRLKAHKVPEFSWIFYVGQNFLMIMLLISCWMKALMYHKFPDFIFSSIYMPYECNSWPIWPHEFGPHASSFQSGRFARCGRSHKQPKQRSRYDSQDSYIYPMLGVKNWNTGCFKTV